MRVRLIDVRLLRLDAGNCGVRRNLRSIFFQSEANLQLFFANLRELLGVFRSDAFCLELEVYFVLQSGLLVIAANIGFVRLLIHQVAVDLDLHVGQVRFRSLVRRFGVEQVARTAGSTISRITVFGSTRWPGRMTILSTRAVVCAAIQ